MFLCFVMLNRVVASIFEFFIKKQNIYLILIVSEMRIYSQSADYIPEQVLDSANSLLIL